MYRVLSIIVFILVIHMIGAWTFDKMVLSSVDKLKNNTKKYVCVRDGIYLEFLWERLLVESAVGISFQDTAMGKKVYSCSYKYTS